MYEEGMVGKECGGGMNQSALLMTEPAPLPRQWLRWRRRWALHQCTSFVIEITGVLLSSALWPASFESAKRPAF